MRFHQLVTEFAKCRIKIPAPQSAIELLHIIRMTNGTKNSHIIRRHIARRKGLSSTAFSQLSDMKACIFQQGDKTFPGGSSIMGFEENKTLAVATAPRHVGGVASPRLNVHLEQQGTRQGGSKFARSLTITSKAESADFIQVTAIADLSIKTANAIIVGDRASSSRTLLPRPAILDFSQGRLAGFGSKMASFAEGKPHLP